MIKTFTFHPTGKKHGYGWLCIISIYSYYIINVCLYDIHSNVLLLQNWALVQCKNRSKTLLWLRLLPISLSHAGRGNYSFSAIMLWEAVSEVKSAETSNCGRFWGPLVMVDVEPLSALNHGQTVNTVKYIMWWSSAILGFHNSQPPLHQLLFLFLTQARNLALRWLISAQTNKQNAIEDLSTCMWVFLQCRLCWPWKLLSVWNLQ